MFTKDDGVTQLGSIRTAFKAAARRAGIPELRPHDLRHIFAKKLAENPEISGLDLMDLGGWRSHRMVKRYVGNMTDQRKRKIIDQIDDDDFGTINDQLKNDEIVSKVA